MISKKKKRSGPVILGRGIQENTPPSPHQNYSRLSETEIWGTSNTIQEAIKASVKGCHANF